MKKKVTRSKKEESVKSDSINDKLLKVIGSLKNEVDAMKKSHNELVDYIAGIESSKKRVEENSTENNDVIEKSEGLMDKKIGTASLGDIVTIAKAYLEQSRMEQNQQNNPDSFFADVGKNAFSSWMESAFGKNFKTKAQDNNGVQ
jgi:hypothetical protein